jgi:hypothetical protein
MNRKTILSPKIRSGTLKVRYIEAQVKLVNYSTPPVAAVSFSVPSLNPHSMQSVNIDVVCSRL